MRTFGLMTGFILTTLDSNSIENEHEMKISPEQLAEAVTHLSSIRDMIRFSVSSLRAYEVDLGQGTTDFFAESAAIVMQTLNLDWDVNAEILDAKLLPSERQAIVDVLEKRINDRIPTAYLLNLSYFAGQPYYVDPRVLIPRSPIAELILAKFHPYFAEDTDSDGLDVVESATYTAPHDFGLSTEYSNPSPKRVLDLCTGSGCIAIAMAHAFEDAYVDASDISMDALSVAAINVEHHAKLEQVSLIESNLFEKIPAQRQYDLIVSNPPYVDAEDMADLPAEFVHEPEMALAAGQDGLDLVRHILAQSADYLTEHGLLVVEVGNSEWALQQAYPEVDFHWINFAKGGHGVFALTSAECRQHQALFKASI